MAKKTLEYFCGTNAAFLTRGLQHHAVALIIPFPLLIPLERPRLARIFHRSGLLCLGRCLRIDNHCPDRCFELYIPRQWILR